MATSEWTGAASSGAIVGIPANILTLHTNDLLFEAMPVMRYDQFAIVRTDLSVQPGGTISFSKYGNIDRGGSIAEATDVVLKSMSKSVITITVTEYMNAIGITAKFLTLSFMDEMFNASILLGRDYAEVTDAMLRDAVFGGTQTQFVDDKTDQAQLSSSDTFELETIDSVIETLATGNALKLADANGEYYIGFFHPHQLRPIKKEMQSIRQYAYPELIFKGEVGEYNGVRFIETSNVPNGAAATTHVAYVATLVEGYDAGSGANQADLYKGVIFGERAYGWAVALPVELREDPGFSTFGRKKGLAWYAIHGAGKIVNENIVVVWTA